MKIQERMGTNRYSSQNVIQGLAQPHQINRVYNRIINQIAPGSTPPLLKRRQHREVRKTKRMFTPRPRPRQLTKHVSPHPKPKPLTDLCQYCDFWDKIKGGCLLQRVSANPKEFTCPFTGKRTTVNLPQMIPQKVPRKNL